MNEKDRIEIGYVARPHGVHGDVVVMLYNPGSDLLRRLENVFLTGKVAKTAEIRFAAPLSKGWKVHFEGFDERAAAESLKGTPVSVERDRLPDLPADENYVADLIGLEVTDANSGERLGRLVRVWETGAHDCYVVDDPQGEILLPATSEVIVDVNLNEGTMQVRPPEGLLELYRNHEDES